MKKPNPIARALRAPALKPKRVAPKKGRGARYQRGKVKEEE